MRKLIDFWCFFELDSQILFLYEVGRYEHFEVVIYNIIYNCMYEEKMCTQDVPVAELLSTYPFSCIQSQNKLYWKKDSELGKQDSFS